LKDENQKKTLKELEKTQRRLREKFPGKDLQIKINASEPELVSE